MDSRPPLTLEESLAAVQDWWREAGVDLAFHDEPARWLASDEPAEPAPAVAKQPVTKPPPSRRIGGDRAAWPQDLSAFHQWWLAEPSLDHGGPSPRLPPRGEAGAALMIVVPMPEADDRDALLSGVQGRMLASFAAAAGLTPDALYLAAALPRPMPVPDWSGLAAEGLGEVLLHHIALARPRRLMVMGSSILPLLGHDPAQAAPAISEIAIQARAVPLLTSFAPERLLGNPRQRAALWQRWLEWTDGDTG